MKYCLNLFTRTVVFADKGTTFWPIKYKACMFCTHETNNFRIPFNKFK